MQHRSLLWYVNCIVVIINNKIYEKRKTKKRNLTNDVNLSVIHTNPKLDVYTGFLLPDTPNRNKPRIPSTLCVIRDRPNERPDIGVDIGWCDYRLKMVDSNFKFLAKTTSSALKFLAHFEVERMRYWPRFVVNLFVCLFRKKFNWNLNCHILNFLLLYFRSNAFKHNFSTIFLRKGS